MKEVYKSLGKTFSSAPSHHFTFQNPYIISCLRIISLHSKNIHVYKIGSQDRSGMPPLGGAPRLCARSWLHLTLMSQNDFYRCSVNEVRRQSGGVHDFSKDPYQNRAPPLWRGAGIIY